MAKLSKETILREENIRIEELNNLKETLTKLKELQIQGKIKAYVILTTHINKRLKSMKWYKLDHWADYITKRLYGFDRKLINNDKPCYYSYIKLGITEHGGTVAIQHGMTSTHCSYGGDLEYYNINTEKDKPRICKFMVENNIKWEEDVFIAIANFKPFDKQEARDNEKLLEKTLNTFN